MELLGGGRRNVCSGTLYEGGHSLDIEYAGSGTPDHDERRYRISMLLHGVMCGKNIVESLLCGGCVRDSSLME